MRDNALLWFGCGNERISFCFDSDYDLFTDTDTDSSEKEERIDKHGEASAVLEKMFNDTRGKFDLSDLAESSKLSSQELTGSLWNLAWEGRITNDSYKTIRNGIMNRFKPVHPPELRGHRRRRRLGFNRWQNTRPFTGNWYALNAANTESLDALDRQELVKDRIRLLFMRYGILFRELLWNELPSFRWSHIFPVLRLMELSGEIVSGHFFKGIPGLQFCTPPALEILTRGLQDEAIFWMNAADPASLCGMGLEELKPLIPHRLATTHMVFHGKKLVLVSRRNGKELFFNVEPEHPRIPEYLEFFKILVGREFQPLKYISVETVNEEPVLKSPYKKPMRDFGFQRDYQSMVLMKKY
jgi:ATP-dependent Lhr-like helicase